MDDNSSTLTQTSTSINLQDKQDHTTKINIVKLRDVSTKIILTYNTISRNGVSTTTPNTHITYDWKLDNQNKLKDLDTIITIKGLEKYVFSYNRLNNTTLV